MGRAPCLGLILREEIDCDDVCMGKGEIDMKELFVKQRLPLTLNIQHFAEDDPGKGDGKETDPVTLTPEELAKKIESESDRKLAKALEKKQAEWEAQLADKLKAERKSAEEYAKMTAKEKEEAKYQERLKELEEREKEINSRELLTQIESDLKENELPLSFAKSLLSVGDNEKIKESIAGIKKDFDSAVNEKVKEALRQDVPNAGGGMSQSNKPLDIAEMARKARIIK